MFYLSYLENGDFNGFRMLDIHDDIPKPRIRVDDELWQELIQKGMNRIIISDITDKDVFTIEDIDMFECIVEASGHVETNVEMLRKGLEAVLRGDMQTLAYILYPEDFEEANIIIKNRTNRLDL